MATKKTPVGDWQPYRTNESPSADGFQMDFHYDGGPVRAKLYWAPADFNDVSDNHKRAYLIIEYSPSGKCNEYGRYEDMLRYAKYIGQILPRRNYKQLCEHAADVTRERIEGLVDQMVVLHHERLAHGMTLSKYCTGSYDYPESIHKLPKDEQKEKIEHIHAQVAKAVNDYNEAKKNPLTPVWDTTEDAKLFLESSSGEHCESVTKMFEGYAMLHDHTMMVATANDIRRAVRHEYDRLGLQPTQDLVEGTCSQLLGLITAPEVDLDNVTGDTSLRGWYKAAYPDDELWQYIWGNVNFYGLHLTLKHGHDVYDFIGVGDSIVRERLFEQLAKMMGRDYEYVYEWWLHHQAA